MMSDYRVDGSKMSPENRTLGGGWGSRMTPKNRTSFKDVLFVFSKARDLHDSLFGGRRMYIYNKYRQRIVFCWWDCIQSTLLMMRYLKHLCLRFCYTFQKKPNSEEIDTFSNQKF